MKKNILGLMLAVACSILSGCDNNGVSTTGKACLGTNHDSLIESMGDKCKKGDIIATKNPAYFCDFKSTVTFNTYNSAMCIYTGNLAEERVEK